jgi:hypothetical protein
MKRPAFTRGVLHEVALQKNKYTLVCLAFRVEGSAYPEKIASVAQYPAGSEP